MEKVYDKQDDKEDKCFSLMQKLPQIRKAAFESKDFYRVEQYLNYHFFQKRAAFSLK